MTLQTTVRGVGELIAALGRVQDDRSPADELPPELAAALIRSGLAAMCLPRRLGGAGRSLRELVHACESVAAVDAGVAWSLFILGTSPWLVSRAGPDLAGRIYDTPDRLVCGVLAPTGTASRQAGGWLLSGSWRFASAHSVSDWIMLMARVEDGPPRLFVVPAGAVKVAERWDGLGLGRSGSATVTVTDLPVGDRDVIDLADPPGWPEASFRLPFKATFAAAAGILLGLAGAAVELLQRSAVRKRPTFGRTQLAGMAGTRAAVARLDGAVAAARLLLYDRVDEVVAAAAACAVTAATQARLRIAMHHVCDTALDAIGTVHRLCGGDAARHDSEISRIFRDAHTASQHYMFSDEIRDAAGAVLLGEPADLDRL